MFAIINPVTPDKNSRLIVGFVADLMFQSKIEPAVEKSGFGIIWIENLGDVFNSSQNFEPDDLGTHMDGPGAALIEKLTLLGPGLLIFDLNNSGIPWQKWITLLKSNPATRKIPIVCYGSHVDTSALQTARLAGADLVTARSNFAKDPLKIIQQHTKSQDDQAIDAACQSQLLPAGIRGLELFNQGEYFEAHEFLEEAWKEDPSPGRVLYQAILQVAVAYLQIERGNYAGAVKMFWRLRQWIDPLPDSCRGVNIQQLREDARYVYLTLTQAGDEKINQFDRRLFKPVDYRL